MRRVLAPILISLLLAGGAVAQEIDAAKLWSKHCEGCHGPDGVGDTPKGRKLKIESLVDPKWTTADSLPKLEKAIHEGNKKKKMPEFDSKMSAEEITAVAKYTQVLAAGKKP